MLTTILVYILIGLFFATEGRGRKGQQAQNLDRGPFDRSSTAFVGVAWLLTGSGLLVAPLLNYFRLGSMTLGSVFGWVGLLIAVGGISVRWWANRTLGEYYTRTLRVTATQARPHVETDTLCFLRGSCYISCRPTPHALDRSKSAADDARAVSPPSHF